MSRVSLCTTLGSNTYAVDNSVRGFIEVTCEQLHLEPWLFVDPERMCDRCRCMSCFSHLKLLTFLDQPFSLVGGVLAAILLVHESILLKMNPLLKKQRAGCTIVPSTQTRADNGLASSLKSNSGSTTSNCGPPGDRIRHGYSDEKKNSRV